ncbi:hypothetical protein HYFRA_00004943 [Hymenoscyphus fraxineus]|uniref:DNA polymerase delta subunit 3 n=1 Tax=Hymenoscyphus fraxineus TaxID=746836 RepID=A0A9N9KPM3_9HELO|nr:hypothetical protein HYFRA_00004943 [Hymenoscyphus fraxineus]
MADYKSYLAARILTEDNAVTYRLLSRVLKVHVNDAKEMLYDFHRSQNQKKPGSVHATYLVSGTKRKEDPPATIGGVKDEDGDDYMQSSPFMGSSMLQPEQDQGTGASSVLEITLVREEDLEKLRSEYEQINSIHIYSLEPNPLKDLQILSDVTRELQELCASEDALESLPTYGAITNPSAKRRATRKPPPPPAATQSKPAPPKSKPAEAKPLPKKEEPKSQPSTAKDFFGKGGKTKEPTKPKGGAASASSKESTPNPPALKKESSSLFKSFAKAKPKAKPEAEESSAAASPAEDSPMKDVISSDDDDDEPFIPAPPKEEIDRNRRQRKEREEALRKMMEDDDEEEDEPSPATKVAEPDEEEEKEAPKTKSKSKSPSEEKEEPPVVSGGRRHGRRRVLKKKTVKDEDGYLVTKEEMAWESFSEDEPVAKPKPKPQTSTAATKKKPVAKAGQGSIMSFFGKK